MKYSFFVITFFLFLLAVSTFAQSETEKGVELYRSGNFTQAIDVLDTVVKADKKDRKAWTYLGASYFKEGNRKKAANAFKKAVSISLSEKERKEINDGLVIKSKLRVQYTDSARHN